LRNRDVFLSPAIAATHKGYRRPETPIEALMMAGANENIVESVVELQPLREAIAECIEKLSDEDRFIVDAINSEMVSLQELGDRLGVSKPHAWRLRNAAYQRLQSLLLENNVIRERLGLDEDETGYSGF